MIRDNRKPLLHAVHALVVLAYATASSAEPIVINVRTYGATGDGRSDDSPALQRAVSALNEAGGGELYFPPGTYLHSEAIAVSGRVIVSGAGAESVLKALAPASAALVFADASQCGAQNLRIVSDARTRLHEQNSAGVVMDNVENCYVKHLSIEGGASAGILIANSRAVTVSENHVADTLADGIHVVNGSSDVVVESNFASNTGDDSFSAVAYASWPKQTDNVIIKSNTSVSSHARGVACIGASRCRIYDNTVNNSRGHGIAVAYESSYNTYHPYGARLVGNQITTAHPKEGTNSVLVSGAKDVEIDSTSIEGGNPVLVSESWGVIVRNLMMNKQAGVPVLERGHVQLNIEGVSANGTALVDRRLIVKKIQ
ncbi:right handed beta helix region family protein [Burkholderia cenocepacia]|uniref:Right handed beta helix region family protein n=1 Tax=Burkholderia cenocepacia TaxID=95486 RepID=A0AAN0RMR8_9BURK|nr:right handed beta helix region family protein [Burkholderia cenocepacia]